MLIENLSEALSPTLESAKLRQTLKQSEMEYIQLGKGCYSLQQGFQVPHDHPSPKYSLAAQSICQSMFSLYKLLEKEIIEIKYCC